MNPMTPVAELYDCIAQPADQYRKKTAPPVASLINNRRIDQVDTLKIAEHARALLEAHGDKAEAEVAQKASALNALGKTDEAAQWDKVRKAIHELRSGHVS
jgi:thioredoxin-like negative regulator of GroEL